MKRGPIVEPYRNQSEAPAPAAKPTFASVVVPRPVFQSPSEARAFQGAVLAVDRKPGEELHEWLERVARVAEEACR